MSVKRKIKNTPQAIDVLTNLGIEFSQTKDYLVFNLSKGEYKTLCDIVSDESELSREREKHAKKYPFQHYRSH